MSKRSTINGFEFPAPLNRASHRQRAEPERTRIVLPSEGIPAVAGPRLSFDVYYHPDGTCETCGHNDCSCKISQPAAATPRCPYCQFPMPCDCRAAAEEDVLPEGWRDTGVGVYEHVSGARVEVGLNGAAWYGRTACAGHVSGRTRDEAMAAALGFEIREHENCYGDGSSRYSFWRSDVGDDHLRTLWRARENAANEALAFDAEQRKPQQAADPKLFAWVPNSTHPGQFERNDFRAGVWRGELSGRWYAGPADERLGKHRYSRIWQQVDLCNPHPSPALRRPDDRRGRRAEDARKPDVRQPGDIPPGWRLEHGHLFYAPDGKITALSPVIWNAEPDGWPAGHWHPGANKGEAVPMHEAMRRARGLATVAELWTQ